MRFALKYLFVFLMPFMAFASEADPTVIVIFGATGDLTSKKILPAIEQLDRDGRLPEQFAVVGVGRKSEEAFRKKNSSDIYYVQADFDEDAGYERLSEVLNQIDQDFGASSHRIFFLSTPPKYFSTIVEKLHQHKMIYEPGQEKWSRVIIEKPFGTDLESAIELQTNLSQFLDESQIYRIDHYLGKEGVQNLTDFRLSRKLESIWNHEHIDRVEITISEDIGIGSRASFWEETGLLRDIVQNHLMQLFSLVTMEVNGDLAAEKIKVLQAIRPLDMESVIRGQYGPGEVKGVKVLGYKEEEGVPETTTAETYFAATLFVDNERWKGVPFTIQAGKRLPKQLAEITVHFINRDDKQVATNDSARQSQIEAASKEAELRTSENHCREARRASRIDLTKPQPVVCHLVEAPVNKSKETLHIRIQPNPAIFFEEGDHFSFEPFDYKEAYQKLIVDCINGDQSSFVQGEEQMAAWRLFTPVLEHWKTEPHMLTYPAGTWCLSQTDSQ